VCCIYCKVPVFTVRRRCRMRLRYSEDRPKDDVPRDIYGRPLQNLGVKPAPAKISGKTGKRIFK
jgi:hypothetical protein